MPSDRPSRWRLVLRALGVVLGVAGWIVWWSVSVPPFSPVGAAFLWLGALLVCGAALFSRWPIPPPSEATLTAMALVALAVIPRSVALSEAPYGLALDEVIHPFLGLQVLREYPWDLASGVSTYFKTPYLTQALQAWPCYFFKPLLAMRFASLVVGVASLLATYALAGRLFSRSAAVVAVTVLACSYWHIAYSRMGYPFMQPALFVVLTLHVLVLGTERRNRFLQFVGGVLLGTSLLVYTPARVVIPVFAAWILHRTLFGKMRIRDLGAAAAAIVLGAAIFLSPYVRSEGSGGVLHRYRETTMGAVGPLHLLGQSGWMSDAGRELLARQVVAAAHIYYDRGAQIALHDVVARPLVDRVSLALGLLGLGVALMRFRDSSCFLLVVWAAGTFVFGQVLTDIPEAAYRAAPLLPALAIAAGLAVQLIEKVVQRGLGKWRGYRYVRFAAVAVLIAAVAPANALYLQAYFDQRAIDPIGGMARFIEEGSREPVYYLLTTSEPYANHEVFRFLGLGRTVRDTPSLMDSLGKGVDPSRGAVFVLGPGMEDAVTAIQRCYPGARLLGEPGASRDAPVLGVAVSLGSLLTGRGCEAPARGPGLLARYFRGPSWEGEVVRERLEDWPVRWGSGAEEDDFLSIEWSGFIRIPVSGEYFFRLLMNGEGIEQTRGEVTIGSKIHFEKQQDSRASFDAGIYPIRFRCRPERPRGYCLLQWEAPGGPIALIPPQFLVPPVDRSSSSRDQGISR